MLAVQSGKEQSIADLPPLAGDREANVYFSLLRRLDGSDVAGGLGPEDPDLSMRQQPAAQIERIAPPHRLIARSAVGQDQPGGLITMHALGFGPNFNRASRRPDNGDGLQACVRFRIEAQRAIDSDPFDPGLIMR